MKMASPVGAGPTAPLLFARVLARAIILAGPIAAICTLAICTLAICTLAISTLAISTLATSSAARAAERLTVTSQYGPGKPQTLFWERFASLLEDARPGAYDVRIVTGGALGGEKEEAEAIRLGAITGALSTVANLTTWVPEGAALDLPFVFSDRAHVMRAVSGPLGDQLTEAYRTAGFEVPAFIIFGTRHLIADRPFDEPQDVTGLTMRVLQSDLHVALWRALGANPTALPITEAYSALSTGVVDAMDMTKSGYEALKLFEVAPVLSETGHIVAVGVVYFDAAFWDGLPAEERALFGDAAREAAAHFNTLTANEQDQAMARAMKEGADRHAVDQAPWREAVQAFVDNFVAETSDPALAQAVDAIEAAR